MTVSVNHLEPENVIVVTYTDASQLDASIMQAQQEIADILAEQDGVFYRIDDLSQAEMDWNAFVVGIAAATRDVPGSMTDARIRGVLVGDYDMAQMAAESMSQEQYGGRDTPIYPTLDAALDHVRSQIESTS